MNNRLINIPNSKSFFIFGPRQTGKSTLLKSLFNPATDIYYDLLKSEEYLRLMHQPALLREEVQSRKVKRVFIDEIQRIPDLLNEVHWLIEQDKSIQFIFSGSSARKLKRMKANMLGGRAITLQLYPLTTSELGNSFNLMRALQYGTLPAYYFENDTTTLQDQLRAYVETYLEEEIELEAQIRQLGVFIRFLTLAAHENGQILNYSNLGNNISTSYQTIKGYYQILEDTLVGQFLWPYSHSVRKTLVKHPKFYFFDPGVVRTLTKKLTAPLEIKTTEFGKAFEHWIFLEMVRHNSYFKCDWTFSFYRTNQVEVDIIIETPQEKTFAIEIKGNDTIATNDLHGLKSFKEICPKAHLAVVSMSPKRRMMGDVTILPWQEWLEWMQNCK